MTNTFDWIEIRVPHMETAAAFYHTLFGWDIIRRETADGSDYWIFDTGDAPRTENLRRGALWLRPEPADLGVDDSPGVVYIFVDEIDAVLRKVVDLGGEVVVPKTPQGDALKAYISDPDGNLFGLWQE